MTTTPTPDADVRAALEDASHVPGLTFSPESVLADGHRVVRRRRVAATALGAATVVVVATVAMQLGAGRAGPAPATPPSATLTTAPSASVPLSGTTAGDGIRRGKSFDLAVTPQADGRVRETWTLYRGDSVLDQVTRTTRAVAPGQVSMLMPSESGQEGVVYGYLVTGAVEGDVMVRVATGPLALTGQGSGGSLVEGGTAKVVGTVFMQELAGGATAKDVIGVTWSRTTVTGTSVTWLAGGAALRSERASEGPRAAVVTVSPRTSVLLWREGSHFGVGGSPVVTSSGGSLQLTTQPHGTAAAGMEHDLAVGWVAGTSVALTSTDPADTFTVAYGEPVDGRIPFVARSGNPDVKGTVTVTGGGESVPIESWDQPTS